MKLRLILWSILLILTITGSSYGQTSAVIGQFKDAALQVFANGTCTVQFVPAFGVPGPFTQSGATFNQQPTCTVDVNGNIAVTVTRNDFIQPAKSTWLFTVCPNISGDNCVQINTNVNTANRDLSTTTTTTMNVNSTPMARAYQDSELNLTPNNGAFYFNTLDGLVHFWTGSVWTTSVNSSSVPNAGSCTNQAVIALNNGAPPTCSSITPVFTSGTTGTGSTFVLSSTPTLVGPVISSLGLTITETTAPGSVAGKDIIYGDSTTHRITLIQNGGSTDPVLSDTVTATVQNKTISAVNNTISGLVFTSTNFQANQGTTTTLLHGNAAGQASFGAVTSSDLSLTSTTCTNQFVSAIAANGTATCTTDTLASAQHANQGSTTTVLHGNAAGNPSFGAVVDGDITPAYSGIGSCTNQFITATSRNAAPTCTTATLASAQFANQGSTTTVLHGNAAGNPSFGGVSLTADTSANQGATTTLLHGNAAGQPSFGAVVSADHNITATTCTNQAITAISSTVAGTCSTITSAFVDATIATTTNTVTLTNKRVTPRVITMADAVSVTPTSDTADINIFASTQVAGTLTINAPTGTPTDGQKLILRLKSNNAQTYSFNATYAFSTTVVAPTTLAAGKTDYIGLMWNATNTKWDVVAVDQGH